MKKKKLASMVLAGVIITSAIPAFAATTGINNSNVNQQAKLQQYTVKANKLHVDISGLSLKEAKAKLVTTVKAKRAAKAKRLGIDISGLSKVEAKAKIKAAFETKWAAKAKKLGIDISGLSKNEAKAKIKAAIQEKKAAKLK